MDQLRVRHYTSRETTWQDSKCFGKIRLSFPNGLQLGLERLSIDRIGA